MQSNQRRAVAGLIALAVVLTIAATALVWQESPRQRDTQGNPRTVSPSVSTVLAARSAPEWIEGAPEAGKAVERQAALVTWEKAQDDARVATALQQLHDWLVSLPPPPPPAPEPHLTQVATPQPPTTGGASPWPQIWSGEHSDAWWAAIAQCESGMTNGWRTGYFGLENRPGISSLDYVNQRAVARWIHSWAGDGAWGCAPEANGQVPGG